MLIYNALTDLRLWIVSAMLDFAQWTLPQLNLLLPRQRAALQQAMDVVQEWVTIEEGKVRVRVRIRVRVRVRVSARVRVRVRVTAGYGRGSRVGDN